MWPSCNSPPCAPCACRRIRPDGRFSPARDFRCEIGLTTEGEGAYKRGHGAPPPRCDGVPLKLPQRCFGGKCTRNQSGAEGSVAYLYRLGDIVSPGSLTSESEERETWTAESLRAAFREGEILRVGGRTRLRRYTFQVNTMVDRASNRSDDRSGTSSYVSDQPGKVLIQPESLILAQSERWRQA